MGSDAVLLIELSGASAPQGNDGLRLDTDESITVKANQPGEGRERFFIDLSDVRSGFILDGTARVTIR